MVTNATNLLPYPNLNEAEEELLNANQSKSERKNPIRKIKSEKKSKSIAKSHKLTVRNIFKPEARATLIIKSVPNRSNYFKEEFESEGNLLRWR